MSKVDWSFAPEGATSFVGGNWPWRKVECDIEYYWSVCLYEWCELPIIQRKQPKPWSGPEDGLPPVGTVCEWKEKTGFQWVKANVLFISEQSLVLQRSDGFEWQMLTKRAVFRQFKTEEQQAVDQRETAIRELMDIAQVDCRVTAARLVDAGFKLEVV